MTIPTRTLPLLAIPVSLALGAVVFVVACGVPLPTAPTNEATTPATEAPAATSGEIPRGSGEPRSEPAFTPMTVRPALRNATEVVQVLRAEYPALLRDAGIEGAPLLWIHIATSGAVDDARIFESSGYGPLDQAAINVARAMVFSPAMNGDLVTDVWVQIPVRFAVN
jgi:TonB family protein